MGRHEAWHCCQHWDVVLQTEAVPHTMLSSCRMLQLHTLSFLPVLFPHTNSAKGMNTHTFVFWILCSDLCMLDGMRLEGFPLSAPGVALLGNESPGSSVWRSTEL
jgi:hypothetical protein